MSNSQGIRKSMSESKSYKAKQVFLKTPIITHNVWWFIDG